MESRQRRLWMRRQQLLRESADLRERLHAHALGLAPALGLADRGWAAGLWLRDHPLLPAAALALLALRGPRRMLRWGRRAWSAWRLFRRLRAAWAPRAALLAALFGRSPH